jgi:hypothetical protein
MQGRAAGRVLVCTAGLCGCVEPCRCIPLRLRGGPREHPSARPGATPDAGQALPVVEAMSWLAKTALIFAAVSAPPPVAGDTVIGRADSCLQLAQQYCNSSRAHCPRPRIYAVRGASATSDRLQWRCYSAACLVANHSAYRHGSGCTEYCSRDKQITEILATCRLPPSPPPPPSTNRSFAVDLFTYNEGTASCYRIPSLVALPDGRLLAFVAARHYVGDGCQPLHTKQHQNGRVYHGYKLSSDRGDTWTTFVNLTEGFDSSVTVTADARVVSVFPLRSGMGLDGLFMQASKPLTAAHAPIEWDAPRPVHVEPPFDRLDKVTVGPGGGGVLQLRRGAHRGRLLFCGHGHRANDTAPSLTRQRIGYVLVSDNDGRSWRQTGSFEGFNECNLVEGADGSV